jgi:hypothetical protein
MGAVVAAFLAAACATPGPTPPADPVAHVRNLTGTMLSVAITAGDTYAVVDLAVCGGEASPTTTRPPPQYPFFSLAVTESDAGDFLTPIWSRNFSFPSSPIWVTIHPGIVDVSDQGFSATAPPDCDPWPFSQLEPTLAP